MPFVISHLEILTLATDSNVSLFLQAIGVQSDDNGNVVVITKKPNNPQQPAKNQVVTTYGPSTSTRK